MSWPGGSLGWLEEEPVAMPAIGMHRGAPALFLDGAAQFPMFMMSPWGPGEATERGQARIRAAAEAEIHLYSTQQFLDLQHFTEMWPGPDQYDFQQLDHNLQAIIANDPMARIIVKMYVQPPAWWVKLHPAEQMAYADGWQPEDPDHPEVFNGSDQGTFISFASEVWLQDASRMLQALIAHLLQMPWGKRVIGLNLLNGICQEWHYWGSVWDRLPDRSEPMRRRFRAWLKQAYAGDVQRLKEAWRDPAASFEAAEVPGLAERNATAALYFRDPCEERRIIDYYRCQHELTAEVIEHFGKVVKEASQGRFLAGVYYGYIFTCPWYPDGISLAFERIVRSPHIDFLASPAAYEDYTSRGVGGDGLLRGIPESCKVNGKLYISEADEGTYGSPRLMRECEHMPSLEQSISNMRKQFGQMLTRNVGMWWFDWDDGYGLYAHPRHVEALREMKRLADFSMRLDRGNRSEVALVYSLESLYYVSHVRADVSYEVMDQLPHILSRSGLAFDILTDQDLANPQVQDYKLYIFANQFHATSAFSAQLHARFARNKAVALWVYAPGFVAEHGLSAASMQALTGISCGVAWEERCQQVMLDRGGHPLAEVLDGAGTASAAGTIVGIRLGVKDDPDTLRLYGGVGPLLLGSGMRWGPLFYAADPAATSLGTVAEGEEAGLAIKELANWTSVYSSALPLSTAWMRRLARYAGAHVYQEADDVWMANRHFICIPTASRAGTRTIRLPERADVYDWFAGRWIAEQASEFTLELAPYDTRILYVGSKAEWQQGMEA